jgi:hypothetical protein
MHKISSIVEKTLSVVKFTYQEVITGDVVVKEDAKEGGRIG